MPAIRTPLLDIAFESGGPADGAPVLLLHGWPDDATAWHGITPALEQAGYRWVAPWLRGFGQTRFLADDTPRDATGVALAQDALDLADALGWGRFSVIGHDWGGRTAYILAAIAPERLASIAALAIGYSPRGRFVTPPFEQSRRWWYQWFMCTDGGAERVRGDPLGFARIQWDSWGTTDWFDEHMFAAVARSFCSPDWPAITLHGYRSRWMPQPLDPRYAPLRKQVDATEILGVPTLMIQGGADRCDPPEESAGQEPYFAAGYQRVVLEGVGHFPARERPEDVADILCTHLDQHRG
jgi:pimeloyl-ACP methyl ester carboxylesterase